MKNLKTLCAGVMLAAAVTAQAGGILTNTNQSIDFLRNPARDAAIGLDGVYSNPAGVALLPEGLRIGINWQYAHQTRTITSTNPTFQYGKKNNGQTTKQFEGVADAPCIPSIQAAYNKGNWSWQFNFSVPGGGGKCDFADGLGSFESVVGEIAEGLMTLDGAAKTINGMLQEQGRPASLPVYNVSGYDMDSYMQGRQYYFGFQLGTAYKINKDLAIYGGLRLLYGTATYKARISNIQVGTTDEYKDFGTFLPKAQSQAKACIATLEAMQQQVSADAKQYEDAGAAVPAELRQKYGTLHAYLTRLQASDKRLEDITKYSDGVNLLCNQSSVGIAPVVGVDYRLGRVNFAAKYEFKTQIRMKNESTVFKAGEIDAVNKYKDGEEVNEDAPALLTVGVQWEPLNGIRVNGGWHYYFDKDVDWYNNSENLLDHNSYELLLGAEWDINDRLTVSTGAQLTRYGMTDAYMSDMSFVVNSYSLGLGFNYKVSDLVTLKAGYFQTNYGDYNRKNYPKEGVNDTFTRTNRVLGIGCDLSL